MQHSLGLPVGLFQLHHMVLKSCLLIRQDLHLRLPHTERMASALQGGLAMFFTIR